MSEPLLTAIVSTYGAERFFRACMDDLVAQTRLADMEILVIDSGSPQAESSICREYAERFPQVRLVRTEREPLYAAWNRAIGMARGKYLTSANTDDRHHPRFVEIMVAALESRPDVALVYADQYVSQTENETFEACERRKAKVLRWPDFTPEDLMLRCITGSQPVWRRALHEDLGVFNTDYRIAGDYDMWLRIAGKHPFLRVSEPLGVFFDAPDTLSGASNRSRMYLESADIQMARMKEAPWATRVGLRKQLAAELFSRGYRFARQQDLDTAATLMRHAMHLDPWNWSYRKTFWLRVVLRIPFGG